jgi:hypothetical protein
MLIRFQKAVGLAIMIIPPLVMIAAGIVHVARQTQLLLHDARWVVGETVSYYVNRPVRVGHARLGRLGTVVLDQLEIADGPTFASGKMISVQRAVVHYDSSALIFAGARLGGVRFVELIQPSVRVVRLPSGKLNISDLIRPRLRPAGPPFRGVVKVVGGSLSFIDLSAKLHNRRGVDLNELRGVLCADKSPNISFNISGTGSEKLLRQFRVLGRFNTETRVLESDVQVLALNLHRLIPMITGTADVVGIRSGIVTASVGVRTRLPLGGRNPNITGIVRFANLELVPPGFTRWPAKLSGNAVLLGDKLGFDAVGIFAGSGFSVDGTIVGYRNPRVNLTVFSPHPDLSAISRALGVSARVDLSFLQPLVTAFEGVTQIRLGPAPRIWQPRLRVSNLSLAVGYRKGKVTVDSFQFVLRGARVRGNAAFSTSGNQEFQLRAGVRGLRLDYIGFPRSVASSAKVNADVFVLKSAAASRISARVSAQDATLLRVPIVAFTADIDKDLLAHRFKAAAAFNAYGGLVRVRGIVGKGKIDLAYSADAIDIFNLGSGIFKRKDISGTLYLVGRAFGKLRSPVIVGTAEVFDPACGDYVADYAKAAFSTDLQKLIVKDSFVASFPAEIRLSASATGLRTGRIDLAGVAHLKRLETEKLYEIFGRRIDVNGTLSGDFRFSAAYTTELASSNSQRRLTDILADGSVRLDDGVAYGFLVNSSQARLSLANDKLVLSDVDLTTEQAQVSLTGAVDLNMRDVDAKISLTGFELARLGQRLGDYFVIGGNADLKGKVTGKLDSLEVVAESSVKDLTINDVRFDHASLNASYNAVGRLSGEVTLIRGQQSYDIKADNIDLTAGSAGSIEGDFSSVWVPDLRTMLVASPYFSSEKGGKLRRIIERLPLVTDGQVTGQFELSGLVRPPNVQGDTKTNVMDQLRGSARFEATDIAFDSRRMESLSVDLSLDAGAVYVNKAVVVAGNTYASLQPIEPGMPAYRNGSLALEAVVSNIDLSHLGSWIGNRPLMGTAALDFTFEGDPKSPDIRGSVEIVDPGYGAIRFSSLRIAQMRLDSDRLDIGEVLISKDGHQAVAGGYLPWDWAALTVPNNKPFEIAFRLRNEDLSILHTFAPIVDPSPATTGLLQAELKVEGTRDDYKLSGIAKVENGTIALRNFVSRFTNVNIDIGFDGKNVIVNELSARSSSGGAIFLKPGSSVAITSREQGYGTLDLALESIGFVLEESGVLGLREQVRVQIDGGLAIRGSVLEPRIANAAVPGSVGGLTLSNALISFAIREKPFVYSVSLPIRPIFDGVRINLGDRVRVRPPQMDLLVGGGGTIAGQLGGRLSASLDVVLQQGMMRLATSRLRITPGAQMSIKLQPPAQPEISVTGFEATTSVVTTGPLGTRQRYTVTILANGPLTNLNIAFRSNPEGLSREQIIAALGHVEGLVGAGAGELQKELVNVLKAMGTSVLFAPVERVFTEQLGFEEFGIEPGTFAPLSLYVTRRLFDGIYVSYYQRLRASLANVQDTEWQLRFGVKFRKFYSLSLGFDSQQMVSGELTFNKTFGR